MMNATVSQPKSFRGKRKNIEDDNIQREEMDIRRRVHHIVLKFNPHTFPNGTFYTSSKPFIDNELIPNLQGSVLIITCD